MKMVLLFSMIQMVNDNSERVIVLLIDFNGLSRGGWQILLEDTDPVCNR